MGLELDEVGWGSKEQDMVSVLKRLLIALTIEVKHTQIKSQLNRRHAVYTEYWVLTKSTIIRSLELQSMQNHCQLEWAFTSSCLSIYYGQGVLLPVLFQDKPSYRRKHWSLKDRNILIDTFLVIWTLTLPLSSLSPHSGDGGKFSLSQNLIKFPAIIFLTSASISSVLFPLPSYWKPSLTHIWTLL